MQKLWLFAETLKERKNRLTDSLKVESNTMRKKEQEREQKKENGKYGRDHHSSIAVYQIDKDTNKIIKEWGGIRLAERELKIRHISDCCKGRLKTAGGFKWAYVKNYPL